MNLFQAGLSRVSLPVTKAPKCAHKTMGRWLVEVNGKYYGFDHPTQLQKDIWIVEMREQCTDGTTYLKWFCFECGTVQDP